jgi:glutathione S-transferase
VITTKKIPEADVIERFLAKRFGYLGSTPDEELDICIALSQTITIHNVWVFRVVPASAMDVEVREKVLKTFLDVTLRNWVLNCEKQLHVNGGPHLVGEKLSLADIKTAVLMDMFLAIKGVDTYLNEQVAPGLWRLKKAIDTSPGYRSYRESKAFREQDEVTTRKVVPQLEGFDLSKSHIFS